MLKQRVITAVLLLSVLIPSLFSASAYPFGIVSLILIACAAWEWSRLNNFSAQASLINGFVCAAISVSYTHLTLPTIYSV